MSAHPLKDLIKAWRNEASKLRMLRAVSTDKMAEAYEKCIAQLLITHLETEEVTGDLAMQLDRQEEEIALCRAYRQRAEQAEALVAVLEEKVKDLEDELEYWEERASRSEVLIT